MTDRTYARLFDAAFNAGPTTEIERRKELARRAANAASVLVTDMSSETESIVRAELERALGGRAAQAVIAAAKDLRSLPIRKRWMPSKAPKIAIITGAETFSYGEQLYTGLTNGGATVWFYGKSIRIGRRIRNEDERALEDADYIVFLVSRDALKANWVDWELEVIHWLEMRERRERLLPVVVDDMKFEELPARLGPLFGIRWSSVGLDGVVKEIGDRIDEDLKRAKEPTAK